MDILNGTGVPSPYGRGDEHMWLFYIPSKERDIWDKHGQCRLCVTCRECIARPDPVLPAEAKANDLWGGP
eukprot:9935009-Alexandrium_andersonii.AAC.1